MLNCSLKEGGRGGAAVSPESWLLWNVSLHHTRTWPWNSLHPTVRCLLLLLSFKHKSTLKLSTVCGRILSCFEPSKQKRERFLRLHPHNNCTALIFKALRPTFDPPLPAEQTNRNQIVSLVVWTAVRKIRAVGETNLTVKSTDLLSPPSLLPSMAGYNLRRL